MLAAVALGSNLGAREQNLRQAIAHVAELGTITAVSTFYDTEPVGYLDQPRFLNGVLLLETKLEPLQLLRNLLAIELRMGRRRDLVVAKGPRVIDLDLLLMDERVLEMPELTLPHPAMGERAFVLEPLAEIAPDWVHPITGRTSAEMLAIIAQA